MRIIRKILLIVGLALLFYPVIASLIQGNTQQSVISTYESQTEKTKDTAKTKTLQEAEAYNSLLYQTQSAGISLNSQELLSRQSYQSLLNLTGTGMMGSITIPKINAELPIYHGTGDDVLADAIGHVEYTSLPVGGENTHAVLSGHRGLPNAKLFTRLDELETGDIFLITLCGEKLAYKVKDINTILPEDVDCLQIEPGCDLVSLVTCTPYGLNTHRLVVTGERIDYTEAKTIEASTEVSYSWREIVFTALPFVFVIIIVTETLWRYLKKKKGAKKHAEKI